MDKQSFLSIKNFVRQFTIGYDYDNILNVYIALISCFIHHTKPITAQSVWPAEIKQVGKMFAAG
jgi:vacuolar-type H+-ATPase subunit C/Vma6